MKKKYSYILLTSILFFIVVGEAKAQASQRRSQYYDLRRYIGKNAVSTLDSAHICISYSLIYVPDSANLQNVTKDRKVLLIGNEWTHFYSYYVRQSDLALTADFDKGKNSASLKKPLDVREEGYEIFNHVPTQNRTVLEPITDLALYTYKEPIETQQWIISDDTCTVLSYTCQKATTRFRGRDWIVWFSTEVPLSAGPWKLGGLPGLIMKASDSKNHYVFECIGIEQLKKEKQAIIMLKSTWHYINCTRAEYRKNQEKFYNNQVNSLLALGYNVNIVDDAGNRIERIETPNTMFAERKISYGTRVNIADRYKKIPYNPIELE